MVVHFGEELECITQQRLDSIIPTLNTLDKSFFSNKSLRYLSFKNLDLNGFDFSKSDLTGAHFHDVDLQSSNFIGSNLPMAHFYGGYYYNTDFSNSDLSYSLIKSENILNAKLDTANLFGARFIYTIIPFLKRSGTKVFAEYAFYGPRSFEGKLDVMEICSLDGRRDELSLENIHEPNLLNILIKNIDILEPDSGIGFIHISLDGFNKFIRPHLQDYI